MIRPGARIGALEVVAYLGAGGQGMVFLARPWAEGAVHRAAARALLCTRLRAGALAPGLAAQGRLAALKVAYPAMADSLHDEHGYLATPGAVHPHLVRLYRMGFPDVPQPGLGFAHGAIAQASVLYLALAYEAGLPLSLLLARWGRRRPHARWAVAVAAQVTSALAHLHGRGLVHHDVRPANLIVRPGPYTVLLDLGAAESIGTSRRRAVYGALGWLAPERAGAEPAPASPLVDIYGVGLLLKTLTDGAASPALARLIAEATAPDPVRRGAALPSAEALLTRLEELVPDQSAPRVPLLSGPSRSGV